MNGLPRPGAVRAAAQILGPEAALDAPLGALTTYRVGGRAAIAVTVRSRAAAALVARAVAESNLPVLVVGRGSNLLVSDAGFPGIAVVVGASTGRSAADGADLLAVSIDLTGAGGDVVAGAGVALPTLARRSVEAGLAGLEWAVGVPGSVGGGVRMNAGGHGSDMAASLQSVTVADLGVVPVAPDRAVERTLSLVDLVYGYRRSSIRRRDLVLDARFALRPGDADEGRRTIRDIVAWRREHQPGGQNAGSVFTNPPGDSAGRLIESAGQKGRRLGSAMVSAKHANFIQADSGGSANDVRALIDEVRMAVVAHGGIELRTEVRLIGFEEDIDG